MYYLFGISRIGWLTSGASSADTTFLLISSLILTRRNSWNSPSLAQFGNASLPLPHKSLVLKHIQAWRLACERGHRRILVFEDDVILRNNFVDLLQRGLVAANTLEPGWLLYLGGADAKVPDSFFLRIRHSSRCRSLRRRAMSPILPLANKKSLGAMPI